MHKHADCFLFVLIDYFVAYENKAWIGSIVSFADVAIMFLSIKFLLLDVCEH